MWYSSTLNNSLKVELSQITSYPNCSASNVNPYESLMRNFLNSYLGGINCYTYSVALYSITYIIFLSSIQPILNKRYNLLFIEKIEKPYKLKKISISSSNNIHILIQNNFRN